MLRDLPQSPFFPLLKSLDDQSWGWISWPSCPAQSSYLSTWAYRTTKAGGWSCPACSAPVPDLSGPRLFLLEGCMCVHSPFTRILRPCKGALTCRGRWRLPFGNTEREWTSRWWETWDGRQLCILSTCVKDSGFLMTLIGRNPDVLTPCCGAHDAAEWGWSQPTHSPQCVLYASPASSFRTVLGEQKNCKDIKNSQGFALVTSWINVAHLLKLMKQYW